MLTIAIDGWQNETSAFRDDSTATVNSTAYCRHLSNSATPAGGRLPNSGGTIHRRAVRYQ
jgi:hypothetical protein